MIPEENIKKVRESLNEVKRSLKEQEKEAYEVPRLVTGLEMYKVAKISTGLLEMVITLYEELVKVENELAELKKED